MSKLNKDILFLIFKEFQEDSKSLFSCLMVSRIWCETVIPILWRNPWRYNGISYNYKSSLFNIIYYYIFDDIKEFITNQRIQLPSKQSLLFDYFYYCRSINVDTINSIIAIGSSLDYNQFIIQQKFYYFFMKKCPILKYFDMGSIEHQLFYFPEAKARLETICELKCDTSIDSSYFYGLSQFCHYIQILLIVNKDPEPNPGIIKLIDVQKNLKHFEWEDDFYDNYFTGDPYGEVFHTLEKKADSLNHLRIYFQYIGGMEKTLLQETLAKFYKLKTLVFNDYRSFTKEQLEKLRKTVYHDIETLNLEWHGFNMISNIIENSGGCIKKILYKPSNTIEYDFENFNEDSLNFIRKIYKYCPLVEILTIEFSPTNQHFAEFEKLLNICQNLQSLLIITYEDESIEDNNEKNLENGKILLEMLIRSAPISLKEIRFYDDFKFSLENLGDFLEKWRNRPSISMFTTDSIYEENNYETLINFYQIYGVVKNFVHSLDVEDIDFQIDELI